LDINVFGEWKIKEKEILNAEIILQDGSDA